MLRSIQCIIALSFAVGFPAHLKADTVLGKVGEIELTTTEAREALAGLQAEADSPIAPNPDAVNQFVRALLVQRLVLKQAADQEFDQKPEVIAKLVRARESALSEAYLQANSTPPADYPSAAEIEAAYESAKPSLLLPRAYRLAQIYAKDEAAIRTIQKSVTAKGADFAAIAKERSEEKTSAGNGGEIGWLLESQIQPGIREILPKLKDGATSEPVKLEDGWHIIRLIETRESETAKLEQVRPQLITRLRSDKAKELRTQFIAKLLKDHPLAINELELSKILPSP
jgi:parvulin-like peptidyl-prolyl isomerase